MLEQPTLDRWLLKQDVIDQLVNVVKIQARLRILQIEFSR